MIISLTHFQRSIILSHRLHFYCHQLTIRPIINFSMIFAFMKSRSSSQLLNHFFEFINFEMILIVVAHSLFHVLINGYAYFQFSFILI